MDPSQMYEGSGHGAAFWVIYLIVAVVMTVALMGSLILGISRSYEPRKPRVESPEDATPAPRRRHFSGHAHHAA